MPRGKSTRGLADKRRGLAYKLSRRDSANRRNGLPEGWAREALDTYLDGMSQSDIATIMGVSRNTVANAIAKEALYRLMAQKQAERLEEMGLGKGKGNEHGKS